MKTLSNTIEQLIDNSQYNDAVNLVAKEFNIKLKVVSSRWGKHFLGDKDNRCIFKLQLLRGRKSYTFEFGQSIAQGNNEPTLYDVLACLQKYDVESFEDFCSMFGYEPITPTKPIYKAVVKEFQAMQILFSDDELEVLQLIN